MSVRKMVGRGGAVVMPGFADFLANDRSPVAELGVAPGTTVAVGSLEAVSFSVLIPGATSPATDRAAEVDRTPDTLRTKPYSFEELAGRWGCSVDTVEVIVGKNRRVKIGHSRMVRPAMVLQIEKDREGA